MSNEVPISCPLTELGLLKQIRIIWNTITHYYTITINKIDSSQEIKIELRYYHTAFFRIW